MANSASRLWREMTEMMNKQRQMIFAPEINPNTFLFFFQKGDSGHSWSIRDYSVENRVTGPRYAHEFGFTVYDLRSKVVQHRDAPTHRTTDLSFWCRHTRGLNRAYLGSRADVGPVVQIVRPGSTNREPCGAFPIIDRGDFERHGKSRKPRDRERILSSKASEDWVTWTAFRFLERLAPLPWWPDFVELARADNPRLALPVGWEQTPTVRLWDTVASPIGYEQASRERMRNSNDTVWVARSYDPKPVEGMSEIDVTLRNDALVIFAEAKLGSDISLNTTYDPHRNQIVRNIDCVLDQAVDRTPMFWMIVRDTGPGRAYTQLLNHYRDHPETLVGELPHHDHRRVTELAANLCLIRWRDLVAPLARMHLDANDAEIGEIVRELNSRV
jgi:hypothetical protein